MEEAWGSRVLTRGRFFDLVVAQKTGIPNFGPGIWLARSVSGDMGTKSRGLPLLFNFEPQPLPPQSPLYKNHEFPCAGAEMAKSVVVFWSVWLDFLMYYIYFQYKPS